MGLHERKGRLLLGGELMDLRKLHEAALTLSEKALIERFDATAYITYVTALNAINNYSDEDVADTSIDDEIADVFSAFKTYYSARQNGEQSTGKLNIMLLSFKQIMIELYLQASAEERMAILKTFPLEFLKGL